MTTWLLNSAVIPAGGYGDYRYSSATWGDLRDAIIGWGTTVVLPADRLSGVIVSRVGYPETARLIERECRLPPHERVPVSREISALAPGDDAWIVRLRYRVGDPTTKGQPVSTDPDDWEVARLERLT